MSCNQFNIVGEEFDLNYNKKMHADAKPAFLRKKRSNSMPLLNPLIMPQPIHRSGRSHQQIEQQKRGIKNRELPLISLSGIKDQEEEEVHQKIKVIAQRSLKKLEEKYQTIDRWRNKYTLEGTAIGRQKISIDQLFPLIREQKTEKKQEAVVPIEIVRKKSQESSKLVPIRSKQPLSPKIPDHREEGRRLQAELMARLHKNKKYYKVDKELNYFEHIPDSIVSQKKKQLQQCKMEVDNTKKQLKDLFQKKFKSNEIEYQSIVPRNEKKIEKYKVNLNPEQKIKNIRDYKRVLMEEAVQATPEGWNIPNEADGNLNDGQQY